jgi:hypothetical protein
MHQNIDLQGVKVSQPHSVHQNIDLQGVKLHQPHSVHQNIDPQSPLQFQDEQAPPRDSCNVLCLMSNEKKHTLVDFVIHVCGLFKNALRR